jgi:hypothetical protein
MTALTNLVDQTIAEIGSYVRNQESVTVALNTIGANDLTITVDDAKVVNKGMIEIDDELIYIKSANSTSGTLLVLGTAGNPVGRGWRSSGATSHVSGSLVRNNPLFPRDQVRRAINDTIKGMLFPVLENYTFTFTGSQYAYVLPDDVVNITGVSWEFPDSTKVWGLIKRWRLDRNYLYNGETKSAIILNEAPMPGKAVRVQYTRYPVELTDEESLTDSGLPSSCEDVVRLGAMWRLLSTVDPGKVTATSVSADALDQPVAAGASTNAAKYIFQLYTVRLAEEISKQQANFLNTIQYQR